MVDVNGKWMDTAYEIIKLHGCLSQKWDEPCHQVFGELKSKLSLSPMLNFAELDKPFEVHTGASDFAIGRLLM